jgi:uncharacterized protein YgbK (DUF1537 family)
MRPDLSPEAFERLAQDGARGVAVDCAGEDDLAAVGRILWDRRFVLGSQGVESAIIAHFRARGWLPAEAPPRPLPLPVDRIAVVAGSASAVTARQIAWAEAQGWPVIRLDTVALFRSDAEGALARTIEAALSALVEGRNPVVTALRGPDDPALPATRATMAQAGVPPAEGEARIGEALGRILAALAPPVPRLLVAGGDTSGRVARALGLQALEPIAWIAHGASLLRGHRPDGTTIEIILKGGQMGPEDLFGRALGARTEAEAGDRPAPTTTRTSNPQGGPHDQPHRAA